MSEAKSASTYKNVSNVNSILDEVAKLSTNIAKISVIFSLPIGITSLTFYIKETSAPFPILDASLSVFITLITATFGVIFFVISSCVIAILFITGFIKIDFIRRHLPNLRSDLSINKRIIIKGFLKKVLIEYTALYAPFLLFLIVCSIIFYQNFEFKAKIIDINTFTYAMYGFVGGVIISFFILFKYIVNVLHIQENKKLVVKFKTVTKLAVFSILVSLLSLIWFVIALYVLNSVAYSDRFNQWSIIFLSLYVMSFHFIANTTRIGDFGTYIIMIFMLLSTATILLGLSTLTAISLRMLGIGGGVPSTMTVKTIDPVSGRVAVDIVKGCIIISTSSQVSIQPTYNKEHCSLNYILSEKKKVLDTYETVDVYSRSDILKISKW